MIFKRSVNDSHLICQHLLSTLVFIIWLEHRFLVLSVEIPLEKVKKQAETRDVIVFTVYAPQV